MQVKTTPTKVDEKVKIVLVGDGATGKSYLIDRFMTDEYSNYYYGTVFDDYKAVVEVDGKKVELAIFDTAGVEDFDRLRPLSYPDTDAALICFQVREEHSETDTLGNIAEKWLPEIRAHLPKVPIILVGNKKDLRDDPETLRKLQPGAEKPVTTEEGQAIAKKLGAKLYLECSAKTGVGVQEVFEQAARVALTARAASAKKRKKKSKPTCPVS